MAVALRPVPASRAGSGSVTPFMQAVQDVLDGFAAVGPATELSRPGPVPAAADAQVKIRVLAEQLVCEANAVLRDTGNVVGLRDDCGPGALSFTLSFLDRSAVVRTVVSGGRAEACLLAGREPGRDRRRLAGEGELRALVLTLIREGTAGADHAV
jgi:hypothetical protein